MLRKLLLLLLIGFAFTEMNAQNIVSTDVGCGNNTYEFEPQQGVLVNGRYDYIRIAAPTILGDLYGATGNDSTVGIQFDGLQWVFYFASNPANIVFFAPDNSELFPPINGWTDDGSPCGGAATLVVNGAVGVQESIASFYVGCFADTYEFKSITSPNGYDAYRVLQTGTNDLISPWGTSQGAVLSTVELLITYNTTTSLWVISDSGQVFFENTSTSIATPSTGWTASTGCGVGDLVTFVSENTGVLPVNREEFSDIKVYPNPSTGFINISNLKENSRVVISNITGQIVKDVVVGMNDNRIDIQDLPQGFYFVELEGKKTIKLLKR